MQSLHGTSPVESMAVIILLTICRLQEETSRVQDALLENQRFTTAICASFTHSKSYSFENLLDPLQKLLRLSPAVAASMARPDLFERIGQKLNHNKPAIRLNLLRIVRSICDACEEQGALLLKFGLLDTIRELEMSDPAVLVRNMAQELVRSCEDSEDLISNASSVSGGPSGGKKKTALRRTSANTTPPGLRERQMSLPTSPRASSGWDSRDGLDRDGIVYYDRPDRLVQTPRRSRPSAVVASAVSYGLRPSSRDGLNGRLAGALHGPSTPSSPAFGLASSRTNGNSGANSSVELAGARSRLPRTTSTTTRSSRQQPLRSEPNLSNIAGNGVAGARNHTANPRVTREKVYHGLREAESAEPELPSSRRMARRQTSGDHGGKWS